MRIADVVDYLNQHPGVTPEMAARDLGVSVRTLRGYVRRANEALCGIASIELARGAGYSIASTDENAFHDWLSANTGSIAVIPQTPDERVAYLLNDLLSRSTWITLDELSDLLFCSRSVLSHDLKRVEKTFDAFGLTLVKRPHYGMRVEGPELKRRLCLAAAMMHQESVDGSQIGSEERRFAPRDSAHRHILRSIAANVDAAAEAHGLHINPVSYQNLLVHIAVALIRIKNGQYMPMEPLQLHEIECSPEYVVAQEIANSIGEESGVFLPHEEVAYIAIHLAGKQILWSSVDGDNGVISDEVWGVTGSIIERIWKVFHLDFRSDLELRMNLARHIVPLSVRLRYHMIIDNPILTDIKERYLLAWSAAVEAGEILASEYGSVPSDEEIGYIALAFALALERQKAEPVKKNILVVCATGAGSARLLEYRCRQEFGEYVDRIMTCDVLNLDKVDLNGIDYVFTTVPLGRKLDIPVLEVTYFFSDAEAADMKKLLSRDVSVGTLAEAFDQSMFFTHVQATSKDEVLHFLCEKLQSSISVGNEFEKLVFERERISPTAYGNSVAMPHPLEPVSDNTAIAVAILDSPITWDNRNTEVQAIFLISYASSGGKRLNSLFHALADLFIDKIAISKLIETPTWQCLYQLSSRIPLECPFFEIDPSDPSIK